MITFANGGRRFNLRVAGIAIHAGRILLHRAPADPCWTLPRGRPEFFEFSPDARRREIDEEIGVRVRVGRPVWIVESFFTYDSRPCHKVCFYHTTRRGGVPRRRRRRSPALSLAPARRPRRRADPPLVSWPPGCPPHPAARRT